MKLFTRTFAVLMLSMHLAWAGNYIDTGTISPTLLAPPPAEQTEAWNADVAQIVALQKKATTQDIAKAASEKHLRPEMVAEVLGKEVTRAKFPKLFSLLDKVEADGRVVNEAAKQHWATRRPYLASKDVKPLIDAHTNPAYPSGHTSGSLIFAEVLAMIYPEKQEQLLARAAEIAQHRVLAGMHYLHDVEGGRRLAALVLDALMKSESFRADLAAAKAEAKR